MSITKRTALQAAAWTAVGVIGFGAVGELANARPQTAAPASLAQATGPTGPDGKTGDKDPGERMRGPGHKGRGGMGHGFGMKGRVLHGEATVRGKDDVVRVVVTQVGEVTAASATSITVKSTDGYTSTWALTAATQVRKGRAEAKASDIKAGDTVHVHGEKTAAGVVTKGVGIRPTDAEKGSA
jgi:hypothetical protein